MKHFLLSLVLLSGCAEAAPSKKPTPAPKKVPAKVETKQPPPAKCSMLGPDHKTTVDVPCERAP